MRLLGVTDVALFCGAERRRFLEVQGDSVCVYVYVCVCCVCVVLCVCGVVCVCVCEVIST